MYTRQQNSTNYPIPIYLAASGDHRSPVTGLGSAVTILLSRNDMAFVAASGAVTEIGFGYYSLAGNANDRSVLGTLTILASGAGSDVMQPPAYLITSFDPVGAITTILNMLGPISGSGVNTILGYLQALARQDAQTPTDLGGTFDPSADSLQQLAYNINADLIYNQNLDGRLNPAWAAQVDANVSSRAAPGAQMTLTSGEETNVANALLDLSNAVESGETIRQFYRLMQAVIAGESTENSGVVQFKRKDGSTVAITITHDTVGDRTAETFGNLN